MKKINVLFMGTPDFAVPCLEVLHKEHNVVAVVTQPDRPKGRGRKLAASPVKVFAEAAGLKVLQPEKIKTPEMEAELAALAPDLIVVVAFGQILSKKILDIPRLGCVNVHASLLPRYRGAAPIHWSIINGEAKSGVTTMFMDEGLDTGDMILRREVEIGRNMVTGELHDELMALGADLLRETVELLIEGKAPREKQDDSMSNYAPLLKKSTEKIDWSDSAGNLHNKIRGLNPWPGSFCLLNGQNFKVWRADEVLEMADNTSNEPGTIIKIVSDGVLVASGRGVVKLLEVQPAGKKRMSAKDYANGHGINIGDRLE